MTAEEFACLLHAKRIGKGKWIARCPGHADKKPSLSITTGKQQPIVFCCLSQNCTPDSILNAMGLGWRDIVLGGTISPEIRQRLRDQERIRLLENRWLAFTLLKVIGYEDHAYWAAAGRKTDEEIEALRDKLDPERARRNKMQAAIEKHGWDGIWERYLATPKGQQASERYSRGCGRSTTENAPAIAKEGAYV
jgi:hypothetical protein